jgi:cytochrome b561
MPHRSSNKRYDDVNADQYALSLWRCRAGVPLAHRRAGRNGLHGQPESAEQHVYSTASDFTRHIHETTGILIFAIVFARILWRSIDPAPEAPPMEPWMEYSAKAAHVALYVLLIALPLTAIVGAWLEGHPLTLLGIGNFGPILPQSHDLGQSASYIHTILGNVIIWGAGLHAAAALFHHFVLRDNVLISMFPDWQSAAG